MLQATVADWLSWADPALVSWVTLLGAQVTPLEILAFVLSLWMVACNLRVSVWGWPLAIVSSLLYGVFFARGRLYGEAALQLVFVIVSFWGWWQWLKPARVITSEACRDEHHVRAMSASGRAGALVAVLLIWPAMGQILHRVTDTDVPYLDAFPTTLSLIGQYLLGRKWLENWSVWLVVNLASMGLFAYKGFWLTVVLYGIFAVLSVFGWREWQRLARQHAS